MEEAEDLLTCARTARAVLARVTASGDDARMRRWRYRQLITHHHDHRQLTDVEFKEQSHASRWHYWPWTAQQDQLKVTTAVRWYPSPPDSDFVTWLSTTTHAARRRVLVEVCACAPNQ
eukprot:SAG25_NODE_1899_length_2176_cov_2.589312_1_plen_118_part_00